MDKDFLIAKLPVNPIENDLCTRTPLSPHLRGDFVSIPDHCSSPYVCKSSTTELTNAAKSSVSARNVSYAARKAFKSATAA